MSLKKFLAPIFFLSVIVFLLQACSPPKPGIYVNDYIPSGQKSTFNDHNKLLLGGLKTNSKRDLSEIMSKEMIDDHNNLKDIEVISKNIKEGEYTLLDEYYMVNTKRGNDTIEVTSKSINNHNLVYQAEEREMYMAFFGQKGVANQWMVSAMYCKYNYGWKLINLEINPYTQNGKTAAELYEFAKERYAKGYLVDAINAMAGARNCFQPFHGWVYPDGSDMDTFYAKVLHEGNNKYNFPLIISQVPTRPGIFRIFTQTKPDGVFPMIFYTSRLKLSDAAGLKKENEAVRKVIGNIIPGINKDKKYVFYTVFNKKPNSYESVDRYEVTDTIK